MFSISEFVKSIFTMNCVSNLVKESIPNYLHNLPIPDTILGWFSLSISDWARLVPFGVAVGGLSYLSLQVCFSSWLFNSNSIRVKATLELSSKDLQLSTRWTFFRVKLVIECEFEISWSLGPLDLWTLGPLPSSNISYFLLHPLTSSCLFLLLSSFGMVWYGGGLSFDIGD